MDIPFSSSLFKFKDILWELASLKASGLRFFLFKLESLYEFMTKKELMFGLILKIL